MSTRYVADDFGMAETIDRAIVELARARAIDAASVLISARPRDLSELASQPGLHIGLHLDLTWGRPLSDPSAVPDLIGPDGHFHHAETFIRHLLRGHIRGASIEREIAAQIRALEAAIGRPLDHLDGHEHVHCIPAVFAALAPTLAERPGLRLRLGRIAQVWRTPRLVPFDALIAWHRARHALRAGHARFNSPDFTLDYASHGTARRAAHVEVLMHVAHPAVPDASLDPTSYPYRARVAQYQRRMREAPAHA